MNPRDQEENEWTQAFWELTLNNNPRPLADMLKRGEEIPKYASTWIGFLLEPGPASRLMPGTLRFVNRRRFESSIEAFGERIHAGIDVALAKASGMERKRAVSLVAEKNGRSIRYVEGSTRLGERMLSSISSFLAGSADEPRSALVKAMSLLCRLLWNEPRLANDIEKLAREAGVKVRTLRRARKALGVTARKGRSHWWWELPAASKAELLGNSSRWPRISP